MSLITVIGRGHSGTRSISNTLGASGVYMGEPLNKSWDLIPPNDMYEACRIFSKYVDWEPCPAADADGTDERNFNWSWKRAYECEIPEEFTRRIKSFLHTVLESKAEHKGWKIPETTLCFPWISRMFPDAKYIFWIRNPRDCIIGNHVTDNMNTFGIPYKRMDSDRGKRAISWLYQYKLVKAAPHPKNWIEVRLEDFIFKQEETLTRLEKFLGFPLVRIPVKPEVVDRWIKDEEDLDADPNYFPFFEPAMHEYGYHVPTSYKTTLHTLPFFDTTSDEAKVPQYSLPDLLTLNSGEKVTSKEQWPARRQELLDIMSNEEYGIMPQGDVKIDAELLESGTAFNGKAIREQTRLTLSRDPGDGMKKVSFNMLVYRPANTDGKKVPAFLGLNFHGNQTVTKDTEIIPPTSWNSDTEQYGILNGKPTEASRGSSTEQWSAELLVDNGFALATVYYGDIDPDYHDCFHNGVHPLFQGPEWTRPAANEWATIGAWAWGMSRTLDYLSTLPWLDSAKVCSIGHSRLGKTSLWAGANDPRFAISYSIQSGCSGAALSKRCYGETIGVIATAFRHWFCPNYDKYIQHEDTMPFDQHFLLALMAPRPVYVSSATEDRWADPKGEFLALQETDKVYNLFNLPGLATEQMPEPEIPVGQTAGYHIKIGPHSVHERDWKAYIAFAKRHFNM